MRATPAMLATLKPGELLVRVVREGWTIPPDHTAIAYANRALSRDVPDAGTYRGRAPNVHQTQCLKGEC